MDGKFAPECLRDYFPAAPTLWVFQFLAPIAERFARALRDCFLLRPLTPEGAILVSFTLRSTLLRPCCLPENDRERNEAIRSAARMWRLTGSEQLKM